MVSRLRRTLVDHRVWVWGLVAAVILGAAGLSYLSPKRGAFLLIMGFSAAALLEHPRLGVYAIVISAMLLPFELSTGTDVTLNISTVLVPISLGLWALDMIRRGQFGIASSRPNRPFLLFLAAGLLSLFIGSATWDPAVPRSSRFLIVQLAQWAVFAFAAGAFWLTANLGHSADRLRRLTFVYLGVASALAILRVVPWAAPLTGRLATLALDRAPFWALLVAIAVSQLLFNKNLSIGWRLFLAAATASVLIYAFVLERATASNWVGVAAALGILAWLRWPRLRWLAIPVLAVLAVTGMLSSTIYDFAGGDAEWTESGGSRLALIGRVVQVTMRNPITGLGPAAYRPYAAIEPLLYRGAFWVAPSINSHNNYVDLFSHTGLLGLGLFLWFAVELILLGLRLRTRFSTGFEAGYVNGMIAAWVSALVLMLFADWILPFVYNIGFPGFQASVLVWLFLGGLVMLENIDIPAGLGAETYRRGD